MKILSPLYLQANPEAAAAPAAPPASEPSNEGATTDVDWGSVSTATPGIDDPDGENAAHEESSSPAETTAPETPTTPPPPASTPTQVQPPPATPVPTPPAPPQPPQPSAEEIAKGRAELEKKIIEGLSERYRGQLTEDDARELSLNPEKVIPRLMAQAVLDAVNSVQGVLQQQLPQVVEQTTRTSAARKEAAKSFFDANPDLAKPEYKSVLDQAAAFYRSTHPNATKEEAVKGVAKVARVTLGLPEPTTTSAPVPQTPAPTRPAAFVPVAPGGSSRPGPAGGKAKTVWDDLIDE